MVAMIRIEDRVFLGFLIVATLAMMWVASPFSGAILWGLVAAIIFAPVNRALIRLLGGHRNTAAALTLILIVGLVIVPAFFLGSLLIDEAVTTYDTLSTERIDMGATLEAVRAGLPKSLLHLVDQVALSDLDRIEERLSSIITSALRVAAEANAKHLVLFHHDPSHSDEMLDELVAEAQCSARGYGLANVSAAYEGMRICLA